MSFHSFYIYPVLFPLFTDTFLCDDMLQMINSLFRVPALGFLFTFIFLSPRDEVRVRVGVAVEKLG